MSPAYHEQNWLLSRKVYVSHDVSPGTARLVCSCLLVLHRGAGGSTPSCIHATTHLALVPVHGVGGASSRVPGACRCVWYVTSSHFRTIWAARPTRGHRVDRPPWGASRVEHSSPRGVHEENTCRARGGHCQRTRHATWVATWGPLMQVRCMACHMACNPGYTVVTRPPMLHALGYMPCNRALHGMLATIWPKRCNQNLFETFSEMTV